jgi:hypothetical protein
MRKSKRKGNGTSELGWKVGSFNSYGVGLRQGF